MTKKFTTLQLFSVVDGRLSTTMDDVYAILNHITGDSLMTHHLPVAMDYLKKVNPAWFQELHNEIMRINVLCDSDFKSCMKMIWADNKEHDIPPLTEAEKAGFGDYMVDNSLLLKKART